MTQDLGRDGSGFCLQCYRLLLIQFDGKVACRSGWATDMDIVCMMITATYEYQRVSSLPNGFAFGRDSTRIFIICHCHCCGVFLRFILQDLALPGPSRVIIIYLYP